jgi:hypothetical protein
MRRFPSALVLALVAVLGAPAAVHAAAPPAEFGTDWDDPRTAGPPVAKPPTPSCTVPIVDHAFVDYSNYVNTFTPPTACPGPWAAVVLHLDGTVKGRQFDRLGWLTIGGVMVFKTSTPEPSPDGIAWSVEKDITAYAPLLRSPQDVTMFLGNIVNETYTGVLFIKVSLTFYAADPGHPAPATASDVIPLAGIRRPNVQAGTGRYSHPDGEDLTGTVTVPPNTERLLAEVYATGSGGGCEEFWYLTAPTASGYSCPADPGPYREVQVLLDDRVVGIAAPYPYVYTGGWSNPFLWYVVPAPRAFDIRPLTYDLSPYVGLLTDGVAHRVAVRVVGVPAGQPGWDTPISFHAWRDPDRVRVTGRLLTHDVDPLTNTSTVKVTGTEHRVATHGTHRLRAVGVVDTSHGRVTTAIDQRVGNDSGHHWGDGENPDSLQATWTDQASSLVIGRSPHAGLTSRAARFTLDGTITVAADNRLTTTIAISDVATDTAVSARGIRVLRLDDSYQGEASFLLGVPRDQRHAVGTSRERYRLTGATRFDHTIETRNGFVTTDR